MGTLESQAAQASGRVEFNRGGFFSSDYTRTYELIKEPFEIADGVTIAPGPYRFQDVQLFYFIEPQSRVTGEINALTGSFYGGTRTEVGYKGRVEVTLAVCDRTPCDA
jgi:hypothetical protein